MQYGSFAGPYAIGPGFATYPAAGATIVSGFEKAIPVTTAATTAYGKPFAKGYGKPFAKRFSKPFTKGFGKPLGFGI